MKRKILAMTLFSLIATPALAEKPPGTGNGKPAAEQKALHQQTQQEREQTKAEDKASKHQGNSRDMDDPKGLEKQREKKAGQEQKERTKGSEQGQQSRETRKKWWKFWGE